MQHRGSKHNIALKIASAVPIPALAAGAGCPPKTRYGMQSVTIRQRHQQGLPTQSLSSALNSFNDFSMMLYASTLIPDVQSIVRTGGFITSTTVILYFPHIAKPAVHAQCPYAGVNQNQLWPTQQYMSTPAAQGQQIPSVRCQPPPYVMLPTAW